MGRPAKKWAHIPLRSAVLSQHKGCQGCVSTRELALDSRLLAYAVNAPSEQKHIFAQRVVFYAARVSCQDDLACAALAHCLDNSLARNLRLSHIIPHYPTIIRIRIDSILKVCILPQTPAKMDTERGGLETCSNQMRACADVPATSNAVIDVPSPELKWSRCARCLMGGAKARNLQIGCTLDSSFTIARMRVENQSWPRLTYSLCR